jgi:hypothetical protein
MCQQLNTTCTSAQESYLQHGVLEDGVVTQVIRLVFIGCTKRVHAVMFEQVYNRSLLDAAGIPTHTEHMRSTWTGDRKKKKKKNILCYRYDAPAVFLMLSSSE